MQHKIIQLPIYLNTGNIGDAIQTVALSQLFGDWDIVGMCRCGPDIAEPLYNVPYILNGCIAAPPQTPNGHFIGVHTSRPRMLLNVNKTIGARDPWTMQFTSLGLAMELIGCSTLLFEQFDGNRHGVYSVDVNGPGQQISHGIGHMLWQDQWSLANELLNKYKEAECVHTSRLHVILPCIAFNTPVIFHPTSDPHWRSRFSILDAMGVDYWHPMCNVGVSDMKSRFINFTEKELGITTSLSAPRMPIPIHK